MNTLKVVVASKNPVKIGAATEGLQRMFPQNYFCVSGVDVPSGVADQPLSDQETLQGATNRVQNAMGTCPDADYWIGIEGGVAFLNEELAAFAWVVVHSKETAGRSRSGTFFLPAAIKDLIATGMELGAANDQVFGHTNSKQKGGAIGLLTDNVVDRKQLYEQALILALVPFKNKAYYPVISTGRQG